jgi:HlyD family secretion protein
MKRKFLTGPRIIGALVMAVLAIAVFLALRTPPVNVELGEVSRGPLTVTVDDLGETRVTNLYVVSAPVTGELLRVPLKPGDRVVARSTLLGRIQPGEPAPIDARATAQAEANVRALTNQLAAARARAREVEAELRLADREYERIAALAPRGFVSQATVDRARTTRQRTQAAEVEARQAAEAAGHNLEAARAALIVPGTPASGRGAVAVTSPVSGYVLRVPQESERIVVAGTAVVEVGDPERLEVVTDLLSADAVRVRPGAAVTIEDWGGERPLRGRVRLVEPFGFLKISALGVEEQRVNVVIDFVEPRQAWARLGHGYRATVRIAVWTAPDVMRVPVSALFRTGPRWAVFVVDAEGRARLRPLAIGPMNDEMAVVRDGLAAGDQVILHPSDRISDGVKVRRRAGA